MSYLRDYLFKFFELLRAAEERKKERDGFHLIGIAGARSCVSHPNAKTVTFLSQLGDGFVVCACCLEIQARTKLENLAIQEQQQ